MYIYLEINHDRVHDLNPARNITDHDKEQEHDHEMNKEKAQTIIPSSHSIKIATIFIYKKVRNMTSYKELGLVNSKELFQKLLKADMQFGF